MVNILIKLVKNSDFINLKKSLQSKVPSKIEFYTYTTGHLLLLKCLTK